MKTAKIIGTGYYLPREVTNEELFTILKQRKCEWVNEFKSEEEFADWGFRASGVKSRHYISGETTETMAYEAANIALKEAGLSPDDIGKVIFNTITPSWQLPGSGIQLQNLLGANRASCETMNQACAGFVWGMVNALYFIRGGFDEPILVVSADSLSLIQTLLDTRNSVLFGDGASACIIVPSENNGFIGKPYTHSKYSDDITLDKFYKRFFFEGLAVAKNAIRRMAAICTEALRGTNYKINDIKYIIPHQANGRFAKGIANELKIVEEKIVDVIKNVGNNSGATVGIALDMLRKGKIVRDNIILELKENDVIVFTALGGGYTEAAIAYRV